MQLRSDRTDGAGVVPQDDLQRDALFGEVDQCLLGVLPQLLDEQDESIRNEVRREVGITVDTGVRVGEQQDPGAIGGERVGAASGADLLLADRRVEDHLWRTQLPCPSVTTADHFRAEENATASTCCQREAGMTSAVAAAVVFASPARASRPSALRTSGSCEPEHTAPTCQDEHFRP